MPLFNLLKPEELDWRIRHSWLEGGRWLNTSVPRNFHSKMDYEWAYRWHLEECWKTLEEVSAQVFGWFILKLDVLPVEKRLVKCICMHDVHRMWYYSECICKFEQHLCLGKIKSWLSLGMESMCIFDLLGIVSAGDSYLLFCLRKLRWGTLISFFLLEETQLESVNSYLGRRIQEHWFFIALLGNLYPD